MSANDPYDDWPDDDGDDLDPDFYDEDGNPYPECGKDSSGGCSLAGTEDCDFECPNRDLMIAQLKRKRKS